MTPNITSPKTAPFLSILVLAAACDKEPAPEQLELGSVESEHWVQTGEEGPVDGVLAVQGSGRDYTLTLTLEDSSQVELEVHTPGETDFTAYEGMDLTITPVISWTDAITGLSIHEGEQLRYALYGTDGNPALDDQFGNGFGTWGETISGSTIDGFHYTWHPIRFATDEGYVDLLPGEVAEVRVQDKLWRLTAIAAYTEVAGNGTDVSDCGEGGDLLSYEIELIEEASAEEPGFLERPAGEPMARRTCG